MLVGVALKRSHTESQWSATFLFTTTSLEKKKRAKKNQEEIVRSKQEKNEREGKWKWKETGQHLQKHKDTEGVRRGGARRVFIYTVGFMASCVCCVAWEPSPPGRRKQHHFKLECPLRRQVSCQKAHGCRIPTKSTDLFPNNCCVHLSHSTERPLSRYTGASVSPLTLNVHSQHDSPVTSEHVTVKKRFFHDMLLISEEQINVF